MGRFIYCHATLRTHSSPGELFHVDVFPLFNFHFVTLKIENSQSKNRKYFLFPKLPKNHDFSNKYISFMVYTEDFLSFLMFLCIFSKTTNKKFGQKLDPAIIR